MNQQTWRELTPQCLSGTSLRTILPPTFFYHEIKKKILIVWTPLSWITCSPKLPNGHSCHSPFPNPVFKQSRLPCIADQVLLFSSADHGLALRASDSGQFQTLFQSVMKEGVKVGDGPSARLPCSYRWLPVVALTTGKRLPWRQVV